MHVFRWNSSISTEFNASCFICYKSKVTIDSPRLRSSEHTQPHAESYGKPFWKLHLCEQVVTILKLLFEKRSAEATPALQHHNGLATDSIELCSAEISNPVPSGMLGQAVVTSVQRPCP